MKKSILIIANNDIGLYKFRKELIQALLQNGHSVYISLPYGSMVEPFIQMGCKYFETCVDRRGMNPATDVKLFLYYMRCIRDIHPDLVITYTIKPNIYGGLACKLLHIPYVINITGLGTAFEKRGWLRWLVVMMYKVSCRKAKKVFFENKENLFLFRKEGIVRRGQAVLLHGAGVNLKEFPMTPYPDQDDELHFLFIGRVMKEKGVDELFNAAHKMKEKNPHVIFDIVGPYEDDYREKVEQMVKEDIIRYHGYQEDVKPYIAASHCFVLPSYHEGMANTLLESAAMGRPLITSDIPGCREAVVNCANGYLCEVRNWEALYERLISFSELSLREKTIMGENSRLLMQKRFDRVEVVKITLQNVL